MQAAFAAQTAVPCFCWEQGEEISSVVQGAALKQLV